jgi:hypothetical protein
MYYPIVPFSERKGYSVENTVNKMPKVCEFVQANQIAAFYNSTKT